MGKIEVKAAALLNAPPEDVFATIADYHNGHPHILPEEFSELRAEEGGYGAGSVIRFKMKVLGVERHFYQRVTEPEPGRVLVEQDIDEPKQIVTTFTVLPAEGGRKSHVEIKTTMVPSPGIMGMIEQLTVPRINSDIYKRELKLLEQVAQKRASNV